MRASLLYILFFLLPYSSFTQEYSYTHFDITEGLAGSTVYCITQDRDGFLWIGTETGVSRFDGTHFVTYTTTDGLPDVEILNMFADSKGRVWMAPFRKSVCYSYKGKIYNQENDSLLKRIRITENIQRFAEDRDGNILIQESRGLQLISPDGQIVQYDSIAGQPIVGCYAISTGRSGHFLVQVHETIFELYHRHFTAIYTLSSTNDVTHPNYIELGQSTLIYRERYDRSCVLSLETGETACFPFGYERYTHIGFGILGDSLAYRNESSGSIEYNLRTKKIRRFLTGLEVSRVFKDDEGNTWFATLGHGIFRLNSDEIRNVELCLRPSEKSGAYMIKTFGNELFVGTGNNGLFRYRPPDFSRYEAKRITIAEKNRIMYAEKFGKDSLVLGSDNFLGLLIRDRPLAPYPLYVKNAFRKNNGELLLATSLGAFLLDLHTFRLLDTLWHERATAIFYRNDTTYVGTMTGLYLVIRNRQTVFLGEKIPFLRKRISTIVQSEDSTLWIASYDDAGIIGYRNGRVVTAITTRQGLTSDIVRTMFVAGRDLWVGTDKGLNRVDLREKGYPVVRYTSRDGLGANVINTVFVDSPMVYVGTAAGLSLFNETKVDDSSGCRLLWLGLTSSGRSRLSDTAHLVLPHTDNNIHFEFVGISYKSSGNIGYRYRMTGLDTAWRQTKETFLDYPSLPPGNYDLQLIAENRSGVNSKMLTVHFEVLAPFWRTAWFYAGLAVCFLLLTWWMVSLRIRWIRAQQREKEQLAKRMAEMEHTALKAQMNPHFIFNCLNSIQQIVFDRDIFLANKYIAGLARLFRATLNNSSQPLISVRDEINYLSTYLSLEKLRFKDKMDYSIEVAAGIDPSVVLIPPMLIQPFAENSMRHGLRHKIQGNGYILVKLDITGDNLLVTVEDNGIGREMAAQYKTHEHIEYQSKGMALTNDRIRMINAVYEENIEVRVIDLHHEGQPAGTRIILTLPLFHQITQKPIS